MGGIISYIELGSIAEELGWQVCDEIVSINGHELQDILDFRFHSSDEFLTVTVKRGAEIADFEIEKDFDESLGVEFKDELFDGVHLCGAHCIFCFVEQLPNGLRKPLYLKDDDYRLSFLHGNFVTLANVTNEELQRIVAQRLSPLYVSVHTTDPTLRECMLSRSCPDILEQINTLAQGRIAIHTQIVLCRGINDGEHLDRTIKDLAAQYPTVQSIAIVPVGVTAHRKNKTPITAIDAQYSAEILDKVVRSQRQFLSEKGTRLVWAADEFYLNAGRRVPKAACYEGFQQIENGVGLVRKFKDSAYRARRKSGEWRVESGERMRTFSLVTGQLAAPVLREWADSIKPYGVSLNVHPITNTLFGDTVTVAGLITGQDIIDQLKGKHIGEALFVPSVSVRDGVFLDDVTVSDVETALGCRVIVVEPLPYALMRAITLSASP